MHKENNEQYREKSEKVHKGKRTSENNHTPFIDKIECYNLS